MIRKLGLQAGLDGGSTATVEDKPEGSAGDTNDDDSEVESGSEAGRRIEGASPDQRKSEARDAAPMRVRGCDSKAEPQVGPRCKPEIGDTVEPEDGSKAQAGERSEGRAGGSAGGDGRRSMRRRSRMVDSRRKSKIARWLGSKIPPDASREEPQG